MGRGVRRRSGTWLLFTKRSVLAFSLTEVMVAMGVAGGIVAAVYAGVAASFQTLRLTRENLRATQILVEKLEAVRLSKWSDLTSCPSNYAFTEKYWPDSTNGDGGVTYYGEITMTDCSFTNVPATYSNSMKQIVITVKWTNQQSGQTYRSEAAGNSNTNRMYLARSRTMSTYVTEHGLQSYIAR